MSMWDHENIRSDNRKHDFGTVNSCFYQHVLNTQKRKNQQLQGTPGVR